MLHSGSFCDWFDLSWVFVKHSCMGVFDAITHSTLMVYPLHLPPISVCRVSYAVFLWKNDLNGSRMVLAC